MNEKEKKLTWKQLAFIEKYIVHFNATRAAREAGYSEKTAYSIGQENLRKPEIMQEIERRLEENHVTANEAIKILADHIHADIGVFFKIVEEWTFAPLQTQEILKSEFIVKNEGTEKEDWVERYLVRRVVIDTDKLTDPRYSHLLRRFSDSTKNGITIELHDKQTAIDKVLRVLGRYKENVDITSAGKPIGKMSDDELLALHTRLSRERDSEADSE